MSSARNLRTYEDRYSRTGQERERGKNGISKPKGERKEKTIEDGENGRDEEARQVRQVHKNRGRKQQHEVKKKKITRGPQRTSTSTFENRINHNPLPKNQKSNNKIVQTSPFAQRQG